ncbi:hypothetical protein CRE_29170 [Caenorhabditis remanei]|uniref:Uncharacterized protein n=1 Tax=Caenorhabditis remanei TaxID=31234 RepID=E3ND39_CAERE|nr:hypothetical protein CRE_29170 [Caenorhabditis remanei]
MDCKKKKTEKKRRRRIAENMRILKKLDIRQAESGFEVEMKKRAQTRNDAASVETPGTSDTPTIVDSNHKPVKQGS